MTWTKSESLVCGSVFEMSYMNEEWGKVFSVPKLYLSVLWIFFSSADLFCGYLWWAIFYVRRRVAVVLIWCHVCHGYVMAHRRVRQRVIWSESLLQPIGYLSFSLAVCGCVWESVQFICTILEWKVLLKIQDYPKTKLLNMDLNWNSSFSVYR